MAGSGSKAAVYVAIGANSIVAVAKFIGFFLSGSGALLSEALHSVADVGNQTLLAVGMHRSQKPADASHPFGYGQEAFIWAMISAVGMFFLGCGVSIAHGVQSLLHKHAHDDVDIAIWVLLFSLVVEGACLLVAIKSLQGDAKRNGKGFFYHLKTTDDPFGVAVLLEDGGAVLGVLIALAAVGLAKWTGNPAFDAAGTIAIGVLLGLTAMYLVAKNRVYLVGKAISSSDQIKLRDVLTNDPVVESVSVQRAVVIGTDNYKISAEIDLDGAVMADQYLQDKDISKLMESLNSPEQFQTYLRDYSEFLVDQVGDEIDRIEQKIRDAIPKATDIDLEPN
jgi:zinc transporter 9